MLLSSFIFCVEHTGMTGAGERFIIQDFRVNQLWNVLLNMKIGNSDIPSPDLENSSRWSEDRRTRVQSLTNSAFPCRDQVEPKHQRPSLSTILPNAEMLPIMVLHSLDT